MPSKCRNNVVFSLHVEKFQKSFFEFLKFSSEKTLWQQEDYKKSMTPGPVAIYLQAEECSEPCQNTYDGGFCENG